MLHERYLSILEARTSDDLLEHMVHFTKLLGFDTVSATVVIDRPVGESDFIAVSNTPSNYVEVFENSNFARRDPVMQHCKRRSVPIVWDQQTYVNAGLADQWDLQASFGYRTGIAMALHLPQGHHFFLGVDRDQALPKDSSELTRMVADLQLFAIHAQEAAAHAMLPTEPAPEPPSLTPREIECLRWTMDGKTAWEVGNILGISERTAVLHVSNATRKLGCVNKLQAVLTALRLGLIR